VLAREGKKPVRPRWDWSQLPLMLTALATVGALYFNTHQTSQALRATRDQVGLSEQGQLTDRFSKAVEQLGTKDSLEVRLGGIYALERIARDSARDHPTVMEVLSAYVREHAPLSLCASTAPRTPPSTDVQAILIVIGRRDQNRDRDALDLSGTCLANANLTHADLTNVHLTNADLTHGNLIDAHLTNADLSGAHLTNTSLPGADLAGAHLFRANLTYSDLSGATLTNTYLSGATLINATLIGADLTNANLFEATLTNADLIGANLTNANLTTAGLTNAGLTNANLTNADLSGADLTNADLSGATLAYTRGLR
jgi:hypothetical protein